MCIIYEERINCVNKLKLFNKYMNKFELVNS